MTPPLPKMMNAAVLYGYDENISQLRIEERPVPQPGPNEVLVKMLAAPINPSDLLFCQGMYGFTRPTPTIAGFEGSGRVVAAGPGLIPRLWLGRRVTCAQQEAGDGVWADYVKLPALQCLPVSKNISDEQASMLLVNPLTAYGLVEAAKQYGQTAAIQTAAGSAIGQMIWRWGKRQGLTLINVVRRPDQAAELRALGMEHVLCSADPDFEAQLTAISAQLRARIAFDAVGGETTRQLVKAMPNGGRVLVYGLLSNQPAQADLVPLIFQKKTVEGFWLRDWIAKRGSIGLLRPFNQVQEMAAAEMRSEVRARYPIAQAVQAIADYRAHMSGGKVLLVGKG